MSGYAAACCCDSEPGPICDCDSSSEIGDGTPRDKVNINFSMLYRRHQVITRQNCPSGGFVPPQNIPGTKRRGASGVGTYADSELDIVYVEGSVPLACRCLGNCQTKVFDFGISAGDPSGTAQVNATYFRDNSAAGTKEYRRGVFQTNNDCNVRVNLLETRRELVNASLSMGVTFGSEEDSLGQSTGLSARSRLYLGPNDLDNVFTSVIDPDEFRDDYYYRSTIVSLNLKFLAFRDIVERNTIDGTNWGDSSSDQFLFDPLPTSTLRLETIYEVGPECDFFSQGTKIATSFSTVYFNDPEGNYFPPYTDVQVTTQNDTTCFEIPGDFGTNCQDVPEVTADGQVITSTFLRDGSISGWSPEYSS